MGTKPRLLAMLRSPEDEMTSTRSTTATRPGRRVIPTKGESLRQQLDRLAGKPRPSLVDFLKTVPPGTRTKEEIDLEFEELRGLPHR